MSKRRAAGEGTLVYDQRRGLWVGRVPRGINRARPAVYGKTQAEARDKLRRTVRDAERGLIVLSENSHLEDYLEQWLEVVRSRVQRGDLAATTAAAPLMSHFIVVIDAPGLSDRPPESNVMPLPTSAMWAFARRGEYVTDTSRGGLSEP